MSNAETGWKSTGFGSIHQDKLPTSHIHRDEAQGRKKIEVPLTYRDSIRLTQRYRMRVDVL